MATRNELLTALGERYRGCGRTEKARILDEFVLVSGYHRKHAMRLLRSEKITGPMTTRRRRVYDVSVRAALIVLWEASDRVCGKRLKPLIPILLESMERHGHLDLAPEVRAGLVAMSAATMDRALKEAKAGMPRVDGGIRRQI